MIYFTDEKYFKCDNTIIFIQFNGDCDFDYTKYDLDWNELDGGILENPELIPTINSEVIESLKSLEDLHGNHTFINQETVPERVLI